MIPADEMGGDPWQVHGNKEFSVCPDRQAGRDEHLESNRTADPPALFGGADQPHEVGNGLWAEGAGPR